MSIKRVEDLDADTLTFSAAFLRELAAEYRRMSKDHLERWLVDAYHQRAIALGSAARRLSAVRGASTKRRAAGNQPGGK